MTRREILREQADVLWRLAESSEIEAVRQELRRLASVCEDAISELRNPSELQAFETDGSNSSEKRG